MECHHSQPKSELMGACEQQSGEEENAHQYGISAEAACSHAASVPVLARNNQQGAEGEVLRNHGQSGWGGLGEGMEEESYGKEEQGGTTGASVRDSEWDKPWSPEEVQQRIRMIVNNSNLSEAEKNAKIQAVFNQPFQQRRRREALQFQIEMEARKFKRSYSNVIDENTGEKMLGCEHYPRNCKIKADCCGMWTVCRLCHDDPCMDHAIDRFKTKEVLCMLCWTTQPVGRNCVKCGEEFARYFCEKCKFYDNTPGKHIYHCDKCTICRVGKGIGYDNFHCDNCDACVSIQHSENHECLKKSLDANCPICGLYLFTSTKPVVFMQCGHTMHSKCFDEYTVAHFTCPLCHKALTDMQPYWSKVDEVVRREVMPPEYSSRIAEVLCYDCGKKSETPFHFSYLRCADCGSYNTVLLRWYQRDQGSSSSAPGPSDRDLQTGCDNSCGDSHSNDSNDLVDSTIAER